MYWVTADLHLDHKNIIRHADRPFIDLESMNELLISNWNDWVDPKDTVVIVGDFAWKRHAHFLQALRGKKILVRGNHDKMSRAVFDQFTAVHDIWQTSIDSQMVIFCHYPLRSWNAKCHGSWHFYGHCHGRLPEYPDTCSCDVGIDVWDYQPVPWPVLKNKMLCKQDPMLRDAGTLRTAVAELRETNRSFLEDTSWIKEN